MSTIPRVTSIDVSTPPAVPTTPALTTEAVTTPAAPVDPVAVALNKLSKTALQNLWDDNWTNQGFFGRIAGLFSYVWNRSTAAAQDTKEAIEAINNFNNASAELVRAVAVRGFTPDEAKKLAIPKLKFSNHAEQAIYSQMQLNAEEKIKAFYDAFKARVSPTQLNIAENSDQFGAYGAAAEKAIQNLAKNEKTEEFVMVGNKKIITTANLTPKIETTLTQFKTKIFDDMVNGFAEQALENITIESFKQKASLIKGYFSKNDTIEIEAKLRQAVKATHDSKEFVDLKAEFVNASANTGSDRYVAAKDARKTKLEAEQTALRTELDAFRGTNGFNGSLHAADDAQKQAEAAVNQKYIELVAAFQQPINGLNQNDRDATITRIIAFIGADAATTASSATATTNVARITTLLGEYQEKVRVLEEKKSAREALQKRFDEVAVYTGTNLTGGLLAKADAGLVDAALNAETVKELRRLANFYGALNKEITDNNKAVEAQHLRALIS